MPPTRPPAALATPVANNSWLAPGLGSPVLANARPAAMDSVKLISAMPRAAGHIRANSDWSGSTHDGRPDGIVPTRATPAARRSNRPDAATATPTATSGAGTRGTSFGSATIIAIVAAATARVTSEVSGLCLTIAIRFSKKPPFWKWMSSSFGTWSTTMTHADSGLETREHGVRDEVGQESEAQRRKPGPAAGRP